MAKRFDVFYPLWINMLNLNPDALVSQELTLASSSQMAPKSHGREPGQVDTLARRNREDLLWSERKKKKVQKNMNSMISFV